MPPRQPPRQPQNPPQTFTLPAGRPVKPVPDGKPENAPPKPVAGCPEPDRSAMVRSRKAASDLESARAGAAAEPTRTRAAGTKRDGDTRYMASSGLGEKGERI